MLKRKSSFNIIDALIIIIIAIVGVGVYMFFSANSTALTEDEALNTSKIRYTVQVGELPREYADSIKVGDTVFDYETGVGIGTVAAVDFKNSVYVGYDKTTGGQKLTSLEDFVDLVITVETSAKKTERYFAIDDISMYIGKNLKMITPGLFCEGSCIYIDTVE